MTLALETLQCEITKTIYRKESKNFSILAGITDEGKSVKIAGTLPVINPGEKYRFDGRWVNIPKHGWQFEVKLYEEVHSLTSIEKYLIKQVNQIGPKYAKRITEHFGEDTLYVLNYEPERLLEIRGIGKQKIELIKRSWVKKDNDGLKKLQYFFYENELETKSINKIYKQYGDESVAKIRENPYVLADEVIGIGFKTADAIAMKIGYDKTSYNRLRSGLLYKLKELGNDSHCYQEWDALAIEAAKPDVLDCKVDIISDAIAEMVFDQSVILEERDIKGSEQRLIYLPSLYAAETETARMLRRIAASKISLPGDFDFSILERSGITYNDTQLDAIKTALNSKVFVLTGGPGTGKTTTTLGIIKMLQSKSVPFLLAAPTGRAAKRLAEATGVEDAKTIHRLLEYSKETECFTRNKDNPLDGKVLIIDESSMIDIKLMYSLLQAVPLHMTIILIGDVDQLPSVGEGNVLRDIINSNMFPIVRLTEIFRQARCSRIITNAHKINDGEMPDLSKDKNSDFYFIYKEYQKDIITEVIGLVKDRLPNFCKISPFEIQVLSPQKKGNIGTIELNKAIQEAINPKSDKEEAKSGDYLFRPGDKVMQNKNNYKKGVFNGDIGFITGVSKDLEKLWVCFDVGSVEYDFSELDELILAYASTVHKSQGSEYPVVIMVVHSSHKYILHRNLLYTGVTRAKKLMIIVGEQTAIQAAIDDIDNCKRNTQLESRLRESTPSQLAS